MRSYRLHRNVLNCLNVNLFFRTQIINALFWSNVKYHLDFRSFQNMHHQSYSKLLWHQVWKRILLVRFQIHLVNYRQVMQVQNENGSNGNYVVPGWYVKIFQRINGVFPGCFHQYFLLWLVQTWMLLCQGDFYFVTLFLKK